MDMKLEVVPIPVSDVDRAMKVYESLGWRLDPHRVDMRTTDSNLWGGASGHTYTLTPKPDGTTDVDVVVVRDGKNFKGRVLGGLLGVIGGASCERSWPRPRRPSKPATAGRQRRDPASSSQIRCNEGGASYG